jgi:hypothetical protein
VLAEVLAIQGDHAVLSADGTSVDTSKVRFASRLGGPWYGVVGGENLFRLPKPAGPLAIGVDGLPGFVMELALSGKHLAMLGGVGLVPVIDEGFIDLGFDVESLMDEGKVEDAWQVVLRGKAQGV